MRPLAGLMGCTGSQGSFKRKLQRVMAEDKHTGGAEWVRGRFNLWAPLFAKGAVSGVFSALRIAAAKT